jgi:predicted amidohydrolase
MRVMLTSLLCAKGDVAGNLARHRDLLTEGRDRGCDLVLFPEMSLTGYSPAAAVPLTHPAVLHLVRETVDAPAVSFGVVEQDRAGGLPFITQLVASHGKVVAVHRKEHLGDGEDGVFQAGAGAGIFEVAGTACTVAICAEIGTEPPYVLGARLVLGPAAPGLYGDRRLSDRDWQRGFAWWRGSVTDDAARLLRPDQVLVVSTQAGATEDEDFPGWAAKLGPGGDVASALPDWRQGRLIVDF